MNYALRSTQLLSVSLVSLIAGFVGVFLHADRSGGESGVGVFLLLWAIAPVLLFWVFLRFSLHQHLFAVASVAMLLGPLAWLIGGIFGPGESTSGLLFVPALQWILAVPVGIWFAFIMQSRTRNARNV